MFLKYSGLNSLRTIYYERLVIKMRDGSTNDDQAHIVKKIKGNINPDLKDQLKFIT